jgi:predicted nucleic acid-binding Zn ribbon protein
MTLKQIRDRKDKKIAEQVRSLRSQGLSQKAIEKIVKRSGSTITRALKGTSIKLPERKCKICETPYTPCRTDSSCCSPKCESALNRRRMGKEYYRNFGMKSYRVQRTKVFNLLGGKCIRCGIDDHRVLQLNHINGGGRKDRTRISKVFVAILNGTRRHEFDLRCANCNILYEYERGKRTP